MGSLSPPRGMPSLLESTDSQVPPVVCQVWLGNLLPDVSRQDILAVLDRFAPVQDVIVFPGHSYAIANFLDEAGAVQAVANLQDQQVSRRLLFQCSPPLALEPQLSSAQGVICILLQLQLNE